MHRFKQFPTIRVSALISGTSRTVTISPCTLAELAQYQDQAVKEHLGFLPETDYFIMRNEDGETLGFCGVTFYRHKVIFKSDYVLPEFRGNGLWQLMFNYRKMLAEAIPTIKYIEATCTAMSIGLYRKQGAVDVKHFIRFTKVHIPLERQ
jgi:GNAT superfamily N-acetyltransferase